MAKNIKFTGNLGSVDVDVLTLEDLGSAPGSIPTLDSEGKIPDAMLPEIPHIQVKIEGVIKGELKGINVVNDD